MTSRTLAYLPSPTQSVWHLSPLPIHAYALCIVAGILVALRVAANRWRTAGGHEGELWDISGWAIVFGITGGRLYHVVSDPELYFKHGEHPLNALKIWDGGLGIWGAVALGGLGAWIGCRRKGIQLSVFADAAAPGIVAAQGVGRWGNWFNNELYGGPTSLPWGLRVHCLDIISGHATPFGHRRRRADLSRQRDRGRAVSADLSVRISLGHQPRHHPDLDQPGAGGWAPVSFSRSTSWDTPPDEAGSKRCVTITPTTSSGYASMTGPRSSCSCSASLSSCGVAEPITKAHTSLNDPRRRSPPDHEGVPGRSRR